MDKLIEVTAEKYSEVLYTWMHMYTEKDAVKTVAKYIEYKIPFYDKDRKLKFLEELIFVYTALAGHVAQSQLMGHDSYNAIRDSFVEKVVNRYGKNISANDPDFRPDFPVKIKEYSSAVSEDERQAEVARIFIGNLPPGGVRKALQSASLAAVSFGKFCADLKETLAKHQVVAEPN